MSQDNDSFNLFDPAGMLKSIRDANLESSSRIMIDLVNSDAYAKATGTILDAWLSNSAPFRKALESALTQVITSLNLPTRADVISLAERLTNIEMRLDDLEVKVDEVQRALAPKPRARAKPANGEGRS